MKYISTRNSDYNVNSCEAVYRGLSPDGGLFVPESIPKMEIPLNELMNKSYNDLAIDILNTMLPDFGYEVISDCVKSGYKYKFDVPECVQISRKGSLSYLELYHGPTSAFKDMALCILPRLITAASEKLGKTEKTVIITATSGDTGKAALEGFADVKNTQIIVFFPENGVSEVQKCQMQTQSGKNVFVCGINGNFDDTQTGVKKAFQELRVEGINFSSANSINIGRLVPQISYYFYSYFQMVKSGVIKMGDKLDYSVPTGNFGDILAGWFAKQMGLPVGKLLCASNKNNVLADFIKTGIYDCRRQFYTTSSPSMDILISSNLERLLFYASGCNSDYVKQLMNQLAEKNYFKVEKDVLLSIQKDFDCDWVSEDECFEEINYQWNENNYLIDTHTAVASCCARRIYKKPCVVLSTANPYKFSQSILKALKCKETDNGFEAMENLNKYTNVEIPKNLSELKKKEIRFKDVVNPEDITKKILSVVEGSNE